MSNLPEGHVDFGFGYTCTEDYYEGEVSFDQGEILDTVLELVDHLLGPDVKLLFPDGSTVSKSEPYADNGLHPFTKILIL